RTIPEPNERILTGLALKALSEADALGKAMDFYGRPLQLDLNFALAWRDFLVRMRIFTSAALTGSPLAAMRPKEPWRTRRNCSQTRPKPSSPWVITNIGCCVITDSPKPRSGGLTKCHQATARS